MPCPLAYSVLQKEVQRQPVNPVRSWRLRPVLGSWTSMVAGYAPRPKAAASQPSPGKVPKAMKCFGSTG